MSDPSFDLFCIFIVSPMSGKLAQSESVHIRIRFILNFYFGPAKLFTSLQFGGVELFGTLFYLFKE